MIRPTQTRVLTWCIITFLQVSIFSFQTEKPVNWTDFLKWETYFALTGYSIEIAVASGYRIHRLPVLSKASIFDLWKIGADDIDQCNYFFLLFTAGLTYSKSPLHGKNVSPTGRKKWSVGGKYTLTQISVVVTQICLWI